MSPTLSDSRSMMSQVSEEQWSSVPVAVRQELFDAYEQWRDGTADADNLRLARAAGCVYYTANGLANTEDGDSHE